MEKKQKFVTAIKYISLSIALLTDGFILYHSALKAEGSKSWQNWATDIWTDLLNEKFSLKEKVKTIEPKNIAIEPNDYLFNNVEGYKDEEIPIGCVKQLNASFYPNNSTNRSVEFFAIPSQNVNLVQEGNMVAVEGLKTGDVVIKAKSVADNSLVSEFKYTIVEKVAPVSFKLEKEQMTISKGNSELIPLDILNDKINSKKLGMCYYDANKLSITSSNESVVSIRKPYAKAMGAGTATIKISNGVIEKNIDVIVENSSSPKVNVSSFNIVGNSNIHIMDIENAENTKLSIDWGESTPTDTNVIWSTDNPAAAIVDNEGNVMGLRKTDLNNDINFVVKAVSVDDPSIYKEFQMKSCHITPSDIFAECNLTKDNEENFVLNTGKSSLIKVKFDEHATKKEYEVRVTNDDVISTHVDGNNINIIGLKEGKTSLIVTSKYDENVKSSEIKITVQTRKLINEDNIEDFSYKIRKYISGHAFLFMISGIFTTLYLFLAHKEKSKKIQLFALLSTIVVGFFFGSLSEFIQLFVPGRVGAWSDIGIDLLGYSVGLLIAAVPIIIYSINRAKKMRND